MKLAKKVLAIVMALGLIACMSAMAFADNSFSVAANKSADGTELYVTVYANGYVGLASGTVKATYNGGAKFKYARMGAQAKLVNDAEGNSFTGETNDTVPGVVTYGFYFRENLWAPGTFKEAGTEAPLDINVSAFDIVTFTFDVKGAFEVKIEVNGQDIYGGNGYGARTFTPADVGIEVTTIKEVSEVPAEKKEEPKPEPKAEEPAAAEEAAPAKTNTASSSKTVVKTDGGKNTGDNGVIAVVAGVIALAGAAFVVTKKRK